VTLCMQQFPGPAIAGAFCNGEIGPGPGTTLSAGVHRQLGLSGAPTVPPDPGGGGGVERMVASQHVKIRFSSGPHQQTRTRHRHRPLQPPRNPVHLRHRQRQGPLPAALAPQQPRLELLRESKSPTPSLTPPSATRQHLWARQVAYPFMQRPMLEPPGLGSPLCRTGQLATGGRSSFPIPVQAETPRSAVCCNQRFSMPSPAPSPLEAKGCSCRAMSPL